MRRAPAVAALFLALLAPDAQALSGVQVGPGEAKVAVSIDDFPEDQHAEDSSAADSFTRELRLQGRTFHEVASVSHGSSLSNPATDNFKLDVDSGVGAFYGTVECGEGAACSSTASADYQRTFTTTRPLKYLVTVNRVPHEISGSAQESVDIRFSALPGQLAEGTNKEGVLQPGSYTVDVHVACDAPMSAGCGDGWKLHLLLLEPPKPSCPDIRIGKAVAQGCFTERKKDGNPTGVFETAGEAWVGGFHLKPRPGGKLVVQNRQARPLQAEGAGVDWLLGSRKVPIPLSEIEPFSDRFGFSFNTAGSIERFAVLPLLEGASAQVTATWDNPGGKGSKIEASVSMEELSKAIGKPLAGKLGLGGRSIGTLAGKLVLTLQNGKPTTISAGELELPEFALELEGTEPPIKEGFGGAKFSAAQVDGSVEWSGEVTVLFPWEGSNGPNQGSLKGALFMRDLHFAGVGLGVAGFELPIGRTGWDLTGVNGTVKFPPKFDFDIGVSAQQHTSFAGVHLLKLGGSLKGLSAATDCTQGTNPFEFQGTFNAPPLEAEGIGELKGNVTMCAYLAGARDFAFEAGVGGTLTVDVGPAKKAVSVTGSAKGYFHGFDFNLDGVYQLKLPLLPSISAQGVFSSEGYAYCGKVGPIEVGIATNNWLEAPTDITGCDFTPYRVPPRPKLVAAASGGARSVEVGTGERGIALAVRGATGAPRVRVKGPHGEAFVTPTADRPLKTKTALILPLDAMKTTYVFLTKPSAGTWTLTPLAGSVAISNLATAQQLPEPKVTAKLGRRKGGRLQLNWTSRKIPGQQIELVDRADGITTTIQKRTPKGKGTVTFKPANPLERKRRIEAVIYRNGQPRPPIVVKRYVLKAPRRPGKPKQPVTAKRTKAGLVIAWGKAARARDYLVTVKAGASVLTRTSTKLRTLTYRLPPKGKLTVTIVGRDAFGRPGLAATAQAS